MDEGDTTAGSAPVTVSRLSLSAAVQSADHVITQHVTSFSPSPPSQPPGARGRAALNDSYGL